MRASCPVATAVSMRPTVLLCLGGLLLGSLLVGGCTSGSSSSPSLPDTTTRSPSSPNDSSSTSTASAPAPTNADASRTVAQRLDDASVAARVKQALVRAQALQRFDFSPTVVRGHLTLRGNVDTREQYQRAERIAKNLSGVTAVTNQLTVEGRSVSDADDTSAGTEAVYHTVRRGDTLSEIAREYDVSVRQLRALNDLSSSLRPGDRVRVR